MRKIYRIQHLTWIFKVHDRCFSIEILLMVQEIGFIGEITPKFKISNLKSSRKSIDLAQVNPKSKIQNPKSNDTAKLFFPSQRFPEVAAGIEEIFGCFVLAANLVVKTAVIEFKL